MSRTRPSFIRMLVFALSLAAILAGGFAGTAYAASAAKTARLERSQERARAALVKARNAADKNISNRAKALESLSLRIGSLRSLTATERSNILAEISSNIGALASLRERVDSAGDAASIAADMREASTTVKNGQIISQASLTASSDRATKIAGLMISLGGKLRTRVAALAAKGSDITALETDLADLDAKVADAESQIASARTETSALNFSAARSSIKSATSDLVAARADISAIIEGIRSR